MKELLKQLLSKWVCHHKWELYNRMNVTDKGKVYKVEDTLICEKCGKIKKISL